VQLLKQRKVMCITYSDCVFVALGIQHAMRMRLLSSVACPVVQYFPTLYHIRQEFRENKHFERKMCFKFH